MYMSAVNPPTYDTTTYNPAFFTTEDTGLTIAQANALFLQKTTPDTASALETFNGGIITGSIDRNSTSNTLTLYPSMGLTQNMGIGTPASIWTSGLPTIKIGDTGYSVHCGAIDLTGNGINNALNPTTGTINFATSQTTGILNIGTAARTGVGAINIGTGSSTAALNIGTGSRSGTGTINIGNGSNTATINIGGSSSGALTLNSTSTGTVSLGGNGGGVTIVPTLSMSSFITLPVGAIVAPAAGTQLGGITSGSIITTGYSAATTVGTLTITAVGVYIVSFAFTQTYTVLPTVHYIAIAGTAAGIPASAYAFTNYGTGAAVAVCDGTFVCRCSAVGTILLNATITGTVTATNNRNFTATRIA